MCKKPILVATVETVNVHSHLLTKNQIWLERTGFIDVAHIAAGKRLQWTPRKYKQIGNCG